ncbi:hypothetical protein KP509_04G082500 [Ceratopteris richardii]|uniref:RecA family profile 1 domain-containing protein n=1 Tax=Ceratopteris richardii TaxID=49495 RepID=A0A8T2UYS4_CERRI|nr:hypothetical protein KP509_04G082500 [Ceratopteris richardii]
MHRAAALAVQTRHELSFSTQSFFSADVHLSIQNLFKYGRAYHSQPCFNICGLKVLCISLIRHAFLGLSSDHMLSGMQFCELPTSSIRRIRRFCSFSSFSQETESDNSSLGRVGSSKKKTKTRIFYVCEHCGESYGQWWGKCNSCKMQGTLKKMVQRFEEGGGAGVRAADKISNDASRWLQMTSESAHGSGGHQYISNSLPGKSWLETGSLTGPRRLPDVLKGISDSDWRIPLVGSTGSEISRVLGGGIVPGSLILLGGDPGVGKSTLLLQICSLLAEGCEFFDPGSVLYVSGEESEDQLCSRANRLNIRPDDLFLYSATDLEIILKAIQSLRPRAVVIDSIQTVYLPEAQGSQGSITQVRECASALLRLAKRNRLPIFLVGHVTRSGDIAGPRVLEHIVDVVLYLEGENSLSHRLLRVVKNRFGSTNEVGVFEMVEDGLMVVENPSQLFLSQREEEREGPVSGAIAVTMEGSRAILIEIQALCFGALYHGSKCTVNGLDPQRLQMIIAVLSKLPEKKFDFQNMIISVVGGFQVREPAADLAMAVAICCSYLDKQIPHDIVFIGEIGLGGELRAVRQLEKRVSEASKLGFKRCVIPKAADKAVRVTNIASVELIHCVAIQEVIEKLVIRSFPDFHR